MCQETKSLRTVPSLLVTSYINENSMFHCYFSSLARSKYLSIFSLSFIFTLWSTRTTKSRLRQVFVVCHLSPDLIFWLGLGDPSLSQNPNNFIHFTGGLSWHIFWLIVGVSPLLMDSPSCDTYRLSSLLRSLGDTWAVSFIHKRMECFMIVLS